MDSLEQHYGCILCAIPCMYVATVQQFFVVRSNGILCGAYAEQFAGRNWNLNNQNMQREHNQTVYNVGKRACEAKELCEIVYLCKRLRCSRKHSMKCAIYVQMTWKFLVIHWYMWSIYLGFNRNVFYSRCYRIMTIFVEFKLNKCIKKVKSHRHKSSTIFEIKHRKRGKLEVIAAISVSKKWVALYF